MKEMIKQKMLKLHRHSSSSIDKSGERIEFKFSSIQALQVPRGWDKLSVSLISVETGKTVSRTGKSSVWNGNCRWTETLSESIWVSQDDAFKELEQWPYKLLVSTGSARSGILGEAEINLAGHMNLETSIPVALPLKKCIHGTILQVDIRCLNPRTKSRNERWKGTGYFTEDANADYDVIDNNSDVSGGRFSRSGGSSSSSNIFSASRPGERGSRETSLSAGGSHRSFDSVEDSSGRESFSPDRNSGEIANGLIGRQDSTGSQNCVPYVPYLVSASPKSNDSPHYLGASGSEKYINNPREDSGHMSHSIPTSPLRTSGSSELVLAEGFTAEEIRAQARMWESNSRKLMLDLEFSRRESNDLIGNLEVANTELSALQGECDGLKQEIKHLKVLLDESARREKATEYLKDQMQDKNDIRAELEKEIRFQKDSNDDLSLQLRKTQESNLELLAILQELEETIEIQKVQIESLSMRKSNPADADMKPSHGQEDEGEAYTDEKVSHKNMREVFNDSDLEGSFLDAETELLVHVEEDDNRKTEVQLQQFLESQKNLENTILYLEKTLDEKAQVIELKQDLMARNLLDCESEWRAILLLKEQEIIDLEAKLSGALAAQVSKDQPRQIPDLIEEMNGLKDNVKWLEKDCTELTDENLQILLQLKESRKDLSTSCTSINSSFDEGLTDVSHNTEESEIHKLESRSKTWHLKEEVNKKELDGVRNDYLQIYCNDLESKCMDLEVQLQAFKERASYLDDELKKCLARAEDQQNEIAELKQQFESKQEGKPNPITQEEQPEIAKDNLDRLNGSLENLCVPEDNVKCGEEENGVIALDAYNAEKGMEDNLEDNFHRQLERLNEELKSSLKEMGKQLLEKISETEKLKLDYLLKEEEIEAQRSNQRGLEVQISNLQNIKSELEGTLEIMQRGRITSQCFSDVGDNLELEGSKDFDTSDNKILERNLRELESCKQDLELNLEELEQENVHLSERISGMEAQLRYLTDARESSRLELEQSETHSIKLRNEIRRLESEMERQKVDMRDKLQDMENRWLDAQQECEYLKKANPQLQATAESLIEECSSLQNSNSELRQQRLELHNRCSALEAELRVSHDNVTDCSKKLEALEEKFSSLLDEIVLKEEVSHLSVQMQVTQYDRGEMASEAIHESVDGIRPETTFEEVEGSSSEMKLDTVRAQYETKITELMDELTTSRRNHEVAVVNHEKLRQQFEHTRSNEEKLHDTVNKLESKLKECEYRRLQWSEEISTFKLQLQKIPVLQEEVLSLKNTLSEMKFEKQRLEASLQLISGDYEELKDERILLFQKISGMQKAVNELDVCKRREVALEEKILRLEGDLTAREALCAEDAYLKNELGRMKRSNSQLQRKIKCLEDEKDERQRKASALEEELEQKKGKHDQNQPTAIILDLYAGPNGSSSLSEATKFSQEEVTGTATQFNRNLQVQQISQSIDNETEVNEQYKNVGSFQEIADITSRVQSLEVELAEALDANEMYRMQLKSFLSEEQLNRSDAPVNLDTTSTISSLETELRELRERYLYISLKYAEVEAEREQLVLKLKPGNNVRGWFS